MKQQRGYPRVTVTPKAERGLTGGHPWVYDTEVADAQPAENGALVDVISAKGRYLGTGFISLHSKIRVRILSRNANDVFDEAFYLRRLSHAWEYRKTVLSGEVSSCRVIFGEADLFPGLTVDRFGRYLVAQTLSVGIERIKPMLFPLLVKLLRDDGLSEEDYFRADAPQAVAWDMLDIWRSTEGSKYNKLYHYHLLNGSSLPITGTERSYQPMELLPHHGWSPLHR